MVRRTQEERINHNAGMIPNQRLRNETIREVITGKRAVRDIVSGERERRGGEADARRFRTNCRERGRAKR